MGKSRSKKKPVKKTVGKVTLNFKVLKSEAQAIKGKARKLCNGNVTQLVRMAVYAWNPKAKDVKKVRASTRK